ncbi:Hypothetical predicted protein, partial [Paramuricea clavata]
ENLEEKLKLKENELKEMEQVKINLETQISSLEKDVENERIHREKAVDEMNEKEKMLIGKKLEVANQLETLETSLAKAKEDLEDNKEAGKRAQNILKTEMDNLSEKLKSERETGEQLKLKLDDTESRLNTKLAAANENLVSARNDVAKCEEKMKGLEDLVKQKETQHFELKGEMAVLEATIENNHDEKRSLLER